MNPSATSGRRGAGRPDEVRVRVPGATAGQWLVDLPAPPPASAGPIARAPNYGAIAIATANDITLLLNDSGTGKREVRTLPIAGATQLALSAYSNGRNSVSVLYYTDASGQPVRYAISTP